MNWSNWRSWEGASIGSNDSSSFRKSGHAGVRAVVRFPSHGFGSPLHDGSSFTYRIFCCLCKATESLAERLSLNPCLNPRPARFLMTLTNAEMGYIACLGRAKIDKVASVAERKQSHKPARRYFRRGG